MRKAQLHTIILVAVIVVALMGMYFIFSQGGMYGRAGEQDQSSSFTLEDGQSKTIDGFVVTFEVVNPMPGAKPEILLINPGDKVTFSNPNNYVLDMMISSKKGPLASFKIQPGGSYEHTFSEGMYVVFLKEGKSQLYILAGTASVECHPFERQCDSATTGKICNIKGLWEPLVCPENTFCIVSKDAKACVGCRTHADCPAGQNCKAGECIIPECNPGERNCTEGKICSPKGVWQDLACPENTFCSDVKGTKACVGCRTHVDCPAGQNCKAGKCITPLACHPSERQCLTATAGQICNQDGTDWNAFDCASEGKACSAKKNTKPCISPSPVLYPAIPV